MTLRRARRTDAGFTLMEVLVAAFLVSIIFVIMAAGLTTSIKSSSLLRYNQEISQAITNYSEQIKAGTYADCASASSFPDPLPAFTEFDPTLRARVTSVRYWNAASAAYSTSCPSPDTGAQEITLSVTLHGVVRTGSFVMRRA